MKHFSAVVFTAAGLLLGSSEAKAQQLGVGVPGPRPTIWSAPVSARAPQTIKTCVPEARHHTKTVYASKDEVYCLPRCSLLYFFWGKNTCEDGRCGDARVRHRLVVKEIDAADTKHCVTQAVTAIPCVSTAPVLDPLGTQRTK
jgi:hypothetical protein